MSSEMQENFPREEDCEFFDRELASFVPDRVFDAHCHLPTQEHSGRYGPLVPGFPSTIGAQEYQQLMGAVCPGRSVSSLFIPIAWDRDILASSNAWVAQEAAKSESSRGLFFVTPQDDPEWVRSEVRRLGLSGYKCYHRFAELPRTWEAEIPDYLPEPLVKVAHEEGWVITLHMVRERAVADPGNLHWIRHYCETYPNMRLILAHSARGFQPAHNLEGLPKLLGLENLYFDCSANCEPIAHEAVLRIHGHKRLLYGSDFYVSHLRGRSVAAADTFLWLYEKTPVWEEMHTKIKPVLIGLEHLRSLKWACWSAGLSDGQVEDIFWNNAAELFGIQ